MIHVIVPRREYAGEICEGNAKLVKQLEAGQITAAKQVLRRSSTTSNTAFGEELGMCPLKEIET